MNLNILHKAIKNKIETRKSLQLQQHVNTALGDRYIKRLSIYCGFTTLIH